MFNIYLKEKNNCIYMMEIYYPNKFVFNIYYNLVSIFNMVFKFDYTFPYPLNDIKLYVLIVF